MCSHAASGPNYSKDSIAAAVAALQAEGAADPGIMVDCSHGNRGDNYKNQVLVAADLAKQISGGSR